ncbi:MAG: division/cell wall cluster transcriptional repressor MraZ [Weeksellaceae bacterium]|nr:division/cell wall cluster transcriptional repressor MraZ [Weeksellaceae bacterium]
MLNLVGSYECKLDDKGRLPLPMALRKQIAAFADEGFVLKRSVFQPCLELYPMSRWNKLMEKINKLNPFQARRNEFVRRFNAGVKLVDVDGNGRIQISKDLLAFAGMEKEVVVYGALDIIEIWDKDKYEASVNNQDIDFAAFTEEVMGNMDFNDLS